MTLEIKIVEKFKTVLDEARSFLIVTHLQPDGDAIGSLLGLGLVLERLGKKVQMTWGEEDLIVPPQYAFLPSSKRFVSPKKVLKEVDCFVALDCASMDRLGLIEPLAKKTGCLVNIDHHPENSCFGQVNLGNETYSSTAEVLYDLFGELHVSIEPDVALCLYVGIVTDTGRFQYSNTNERVFKIAAELVKYGVNPNRVFQNVYENASFSTIKLLGLVLSRSRLIKDKEVVYAVLTDEDIKRTGAELAESENFIDYLRAVKNARLAILFKPVKNRELRVSLRSKNNLDVGAIARMFDGGGHVNAAGFTSPYDLEETLQKIIDLMEKQS